MSFVLGCLGWALLIAGALPSEVQRRIERSVPYWNAQLVSLASSLIEAGLGVVILRSLLVQTGLEDAVPSGGVARTSLGVFLVLEGAIRAVAAGALRSSISSLPLLALWRGAQALAGSSGAGKSKRGVT